MQSKGFQLNMLNPAQMEAVKQIHGPVLILAGAGTGKTRVVTSRIAHMISEGVKPDSILAVTFTNKAATEMRERVGGVVKKAHAELVTVSTFHSLCVRILRTCIERVGYRKNFSIYTGSDQAGLVRKILSKPSVAESAAAGGSAMEPQMAIALISKIKSSGQELPTDSQEPIAEVYRRYQHELKMLNAVDFDDLLILAERALREHEDIRRGWQQKFRYIMVDEFQDTNRLQMELLRNLVDKEMNVCVVGDDDQSIYGWRGAEISNILDFERFFPGPKVVKMEQNYRSTTPILHTANSLIRHNAQRREKSLWSESPGSDTVRLVGMPGDKEEAELIVEEIKEVKMGEKRSWDDFAILFRTNAQTRVFETELRENDIPYRMIGGQSFYDRKEVKDLMSYLAVIANQDDDVNMLRIINNPPRGIGDKTLDDLSRWARTKGISIFAAIRRGRRARSQHLLAPPGRRVLGKVDQARAREGRGIYGSVRAPHRLDERRPCRLPHRV